MPRKDKLTAAVENLNEGKEGMLNCLSSTACADLILQAPRGRPLQRFGVAKDFLVRLYCDHEGTVTQEGLDAKSNADRGIINCLLTLLRPVASTLIPSVPGVVEKVLRLVTTGGGLPSALAMLLLGELRLTDQDLGEHATTLLSKVGECLLRPSCGEEAKMPFGGSLAVAGLMVNKLQIRASAMEAAIVEALGTHSADAVGLRLAATCVAGGMPPCPSRAMQVINAPFGRAVVLTSLAESVVVLALSTVEGATQIQEVKYSELPVPSTAPCESGAVSSPTVHFSSKVVNALLKLRRIQDVDWVRALGNVLPQAPVWEQELVREVVEELNVLSASGIQQHGCAPSELAEHGCVLLGLAATRPNLGTMAVPQPPRRAPALHVADPGSPAAASLKYPEAKVMEALNFSDKWFGKHMIVSAGAQRWSKSKWNLAMTFRFLPKGALEPALHQVFWSYTEPPVCPGASWKVEPDGTVSVRWEMELPSRREAGRGHDAGRWAYVGRLTYGRASDASSKKMPVLQGEATKADGSDGAAKYRFYLAAPNPIEVLHSAIPLAPPPFEVFSRVGFSVGFEKVEAKDITGPLGLEGRHTNALGIARAAVARLPRFEHLNGPLVIQDMTSSGGDDSWGLSDVLEEDSPSRPGAPELRWRSLASVLKHGSEEKQPEVLCAEAAVELGRCRQQLRFQLLMHLLQVMLKSRPRGSCISSVFPEAHQQEAFFKRAVHLSDAEKVLERCAEDFKSSAEVAKVALQVAIEGIFAPFCSVEVAKVKVESDHNYHPNENWFFHLRIPGASSLKITFQDRFRTENNCDFLRFLQSSDPADTNTWHPDSEKICGDLQALPTVFVGAEECWMQWVTDGADQFHGWTFELEGEGASPQAGTAVSFDAALKLLTSVSLCEGAGESTRLLAGTALLTIIGTVPNAKQVGAAAQAIVQLFPSRVRWSDAGWRAALGVMLGAEKAGKRELLASTVTLLTSQMAPERPRTLACGEAQRSPVLVLDKLLPETGGLLLSSRTSLVSNSSDPVRGIGFPVPPPEDPAAALYRICVPRSSVLGATLATGLSVLGPSGELAEPVLCQLPEGHGAPGEELNVVVTLGAAPKPTLQLVTASGDTVATQALPHSWAKAKELLPVLQVKGFGGVLSLLSPLGDSALSEATHSRLDQLKQAGTLVAACRSGRGEDLPASLITGAWVLAQHDAGSALDFERRLRAACRRTCESEHPHGWRRTRQKLEVQGAAALELRFPRVELAEGCRLHVSYDEAGEIPAMCTSVAQKLSDGRIKRYVVYDNYFYASIDNADPDGTQMSTQADYMTLPDGWELSPSDPDIVANVVAKHTFSTHIMVTGDGNGYSSMGHEGGRRAGQLFNTNRLSTQMQHGVPAYKPTAAQFRCLIRRRKPAAQGARPLVVEDVCANDETVIIRGSKVYVHGPLPAHAKWDAVSKDEKGPEEEGVPDVTVKPVLCPGPWKWVLSLAHYVTVMLQSGGDVKFVKTSMNTLTEAELEEINGLMAVLGEGAIDPNASWIRPEQFRCAKVTGSWSETTQSIKLKMDGADDLGTACVAFTSHGEPKRQESGVAIAGDVEHTRWGLRTMEQDGRRSQPGQVVSAWSWPETHEPSLEVRIVEDADGKARLQVLPAGSVLEGGAAKVTSLVLKDDEWVEEVRGTKRPEGGEPQSLQLRTSKNRRLEWQAAVAAAMPRQ